jgi:hypothetical protein
MCLLQQQCVKSTSLSNNINHNRTKAPTIVVAQPAIVYWIIISLKVS